MARRGFVTALVVVGALAPAFAGASPAPGGAITLKPNAPGSGSHLVVSASGTGAGFRKGQIPTSLQLAFQKGFVLDTSAVAGKCTTAVAEKDQCPANSVLGTGSIQVVLNGANYTANVQFFRADPPDAGDQGGVIFYFKEPQSGFNGASVGALKTTDEAPYGELLQFDKLPLPALPPGLDIELDKLQLDIGAGSAAPVIKTPAKHKKHKKKKRYCAKYRGHGKKRHCVKYSTHRPQHKPKAHKTAATSFIVNPPDCSAGTWTVRLSWGYKDGTSEQREGAAPCAGAGQTPSGR